MEQLLLELSNGLHSQKDTSYQLIFLFHLQILNLLIPLKVVTLRVTLHLKTKNRIIFMFFDMVRG